MKTKDGLSLVIAVNMSQEAVDAGQKLPVIVDIGPYFGTSIMQYSAIDARLAEYFIPRGYVVARASLRGTGESEGCFDLGGKLEQQDVVDIVAFLGTQTWSNGNVAVFGKSYDGTTPWMAAINKAPHLKTIVPISGLTDMYRYTFYDGTVYPEEIAFEPYYYLSVGEDISIPGPDGGDPAWDGNAQTLRNSIHPCQIGGLPEHARADFQSTITGNHDDPFWIERDYESRFKDIEVPVFMVHGLQDWNVKMDNQMPLWDELTVPKAAWFGQWAHDYPDINRHNADWSRHDWNETLLTWFDHWLKGVDNDWEDLARVEVQDQVGTWRNYTSWPPTDASTTELVITGGVFRDPLHRGYDIASKTNGLAFATEPFATNVTILGRPTLKLELSIDQPGGNVAVALYDVDPSGKWTQLDHGSRSLMHAETRDTGKPVTPGAAITTTVSFYPQAFTILEGHQLALTVGSDLPEWIQPSLFAPTYTIKSGTLTLQSESNATAALRAAVLAPLAPALEIIK